MSLIDRVELGIRSIISLILGKPSNFGWFRPFLAASGLPYGRRAYEWLKNQGIDVVINLTEKELNYGSLESHHFPLKNREAANPQDLSLIVNLISFLKDVNKRTLVHCVAGKGRTGMVLASYLIAKEDYSAESAIKEVREKRPGSLNIGRQIDAIYRFEKYISIAKGIYTIILAAGMSTRFGRNKLLEPIDGKPLIRGVVEAAVRAGTETVVVVGYEKEKIIEALRGLKLEIVFNPDFKEGMSTSVKAGVRNVINRAKAVMILPGDVAFIKPEQIRLVLEAYLSSKKPIVIPSYKGRGGHPILFDSSLFNDIMSISERGRGLKEVVKKHADKISYIEAGTARILVDIDTQEDLVKRVREIEG